MVFFPRHVAVSASTEIDIANLVKQVKSESKSKNPVRCFWGFALFHFLGDSKRLTLTNKFLRHRALTFGDVTC